MAAAPDTPHVPDWSTVVLSCAAMGRADAWAMAHGQSGPVLMERAGAGVVQALQARWLPCPVWVWCGPGNNGGDGWVVARLLAAAGWAQVAVACDTPIEALQGDAAHHARLWRQAEERAGRVALVHSVADSLALIQAHVASQREPGVLVDALFGAGLARPLAPDVHAALGQVAAWRGQGRLAVVAVDVPSGMHGDTGWGLSGQSVPCPADLTVTFMAPKPAHVLMPGRRLMGDLVVHDIGLPLAALVAEADASSAGSEHQATARPWVWRNTAAAWRAHWQPPRADGHKYHRGHVLVWSGPQMPGASRLSARAAARIGAGLVTLAMTRTAWPHLAGQLMAAMAHALDDASAASLLADWQALLGSRRWGGLVLGPGAMPGLPHQALRISNDSGAAATLRAMVLAALAADMPVVLDADALMAFEGDPAPLFEALHARAARTGRVSVVLTPHEGEFTRLFGAEEGLDKFSRTAQAAARAQAVVLHKGPDTVLAAPDGRLMLHDHAPPWLATAGAGDVLAGFVAGLMAQGLDAWHAALAAAWVHGQCAHRFGPGLLADDLPEQVPAVLRQLWGVRSAEA